MFGLGPLYTPASSNGYAVLFNTVLTGMLAILAQAYQCFWPVVYNGASIKCSHMLTLPTILVPTHLALAGTISSHDLIVHIAGVHCLDSFRQSRCQPRLYRWDTDGNSSGSILVEQLFTRLCTSHIEFILTF